MTIYIGSDHAGFALKQGLLPYLKQCNYEVVDTGAFSLEEGDDYPKYVQTLTEKILTTEGSKGIFCAGSGQGEAMCANRVPGIRAGVFYGPQIAHSAVSPEGEAATDEYDGVRLLRTHNDANLLSIGARFVTKEEAEEAVRIFLTTPFSKEPRHARRIAKF